MVVPTGRVSGAVRLKTKVNLHIAEGATLAFSRDANKYLPLVLTRFEGMELMNYSPFIYALDEHEVAITGTGTLDGQANEEFWWSFRSTQMPARNRLLEMCAKGAAPSERRVGPDRWLQPNFIQPDVSCFYFHDAAVQTNGVDDPLKQRTDQRFSSATPCGTSRRRCRMCAPTRCT